MSKYKTLCFAAIVSFLTAGPVSAGEWILQVGIKTISVQPNGNIYLLIDKTIPDLGCTGGSSSGWLQFDTSAPFFKEQYALLLSAYTTQTKVRIYADKCGYYPYAQNSMFEIQ